MVFVPPDAPPSVVIDALAAAATDLWSDVETTLLERLSELVRSDMHLEQVGDRLRLLRALRVTVNDALATIPADAAQQLLDVAAEYGAANALAELTGLPTRPYGELAPLGTAHLHGLVNTATDLVSRWEDVKNRVLRFPDDVHQRFGARAIADRLAGAPSHQAQQLDLIKRWYRQGVPAFTDVSGRTWRVGSYIEMSTRTGTQRALTEGRSAQMVAAGVRLGTIREAAAACDVCAPWNGALVSLDGTPAGTVTLFSAVDDSYVTVNVAATIEDARRAGWQHPNCRGRIAAFIPGATRTTPPNEVDADRNRAEQDMREAERDIRAAKRALALDPEDARARADLRDARARLRAAQTAGDLPRMSWREQLSWAS